MPKITIGRSESDLENLGEEKATAYIGRHLVGEKREAHVANPLRMDIARPHVIGIFGKRGSGKCVTPETKIMLSDDSLSKIKEIFKDFGGDFIRKGKNEEVLIPKKELEVKSLSKDLKLETRRVKALYRKKVDETLLKIKTSDGREITVTKEHPLLSPELKWMKSGKLSQGDLIAVPRKFSTERGPLEVKSSGKGYIELKKPEICTSQKKGEKILQSSCQKTSEIPEVFWDKIEEVKEIDYKGWVYDLTVERNHNFIAGYGGIFCHNSYTLGVIAEELMTAETTLKDNLSTIIVDTMGIYWAMKNPNDRAMSLLEEWDMKPKGVDTDHYIPEGQVEKFGENEIPYDETFTLKPGGLSASDWAMAFEIDSNEPMGILLERAMRNLKSDKGEDFGIDDLIGYVRDVEGFKDKVKEALVNRFLSAKDWGIFSREGMDLEKLTQRGKVSVLDVSLFGEITGGWSVRTLVVGLLAKRFLKERMQARRIEEIEEMEGTVRSEMPIVWMILDEAHTFVPAEGETPASQPLLQWVKLGREPGVSLACATQRPNKLHNDVISQSDIIISHRLTAKPDIDALRNIMQTYMRYDLAQYIDNLPRQEGAAICLDDNSERIYTLQVRPRFSWHAGGTPIAIKSNE